MAIFSKSPIRQIKNLTKVSRYMYTLCRTLKLKVTRTIVGEDVKISVAPIIGLAIGIGQYWALSGISAVCFDSAFPISS